MIRQVVTRGNILLLIEWLFLVTGLAALTITEQYQVYVTFGLIFLVVSFLVRAWRTNSFMPKTGLEIPWALFIASALVAVWAAYDQATALLQFYRIIAAFVLYYAVVNSKPGLLRWLTIGFLFAGLTLAIYWTLQHDFTAQPGKISLITRIGAWVNQHIPSIPGPSIHNNVAAGVLVVAVPFGMASFLPGNPLTAISNKKIFRWISFIATIIILAGLFMTSSRGGWLALGVTGLVAVLVYIQRHFFGNSWRKKVFWMAVFVLGISISFVLVSMIGLDRLTGKIPDPTGSLQSRQDLWKQGWGLIQDAPFTGHGLMSFWMVHGIYALLIQTPVIHHSHNTIIEIWFEQGILAFLAILLFTIIIAKWAWNALSQKNTPLWGWAGIAALFAAAIHGMVDVVFYIERTLPVIGLILGFAWFLNTNPVEKTKIKIKKDRKWIWWTIGLILVSTLTLILVFRKTLLSAWYANLGVIIQQRNELQVYDPKLFDKKSIDQIRQEMNLEPFQKYFQKSLGMNPNNRTALQRMTAIALSKMEYDSSLQYGHKLWENGYRDDISRLLYSDALVANFQDTMGAEIVRGLRWAEYRLMGQAWYRYWLNADYERAASAWSAVLILNPDNSEAKKWLENAREKKQ